MNEMAVIVAALDEGNPNLEELTPEEWARNMALDAWAAHGKVDATTIRHELVTETFGDMTFKVYKFTAQVR